MKLVYKFCWLFLIVLLGAASVPSSEGRREFTKTIKKEFDISKDGTVGILTKYGKVDVKIWERNRVKVEVQIIVRTLNETSAQEVFKRINVDFSNYNNYVKAVTNINTNKEWWSGWGDNKTDYTINYEVYMPATNRLELETKHCDVLVGNLNEGAMVDMKYGNFKFEGLAEETELNLTFCNGQIEKAKHINAVLSHCTLKLLTVAEADISSRYSNLSIEKAGDVRVDSKYDNYKLGEVANFRNSGQYDNIEILGASNVFIDSKYSNIIADHIQNQLDVELEHGGIIVARLAKGFSGVNLLGRFTDFQLGIESGAKYTLDASADYAGIGYPQGLNVTYEKAKSTTHEVMGHQGGTTGAGLIKARLNYGALKMRQN
ncbi:MAG: hypothetical protein R2828_14080 [Saprospiraceae bacterium]